jgi:uncharacterized protein (DUF362 family)
MTTLKRRTFLKNGLIAGGAVLLTNQISGSAILPSFYKPFSPSPEGEMPDIVSISGEFPEENIPKLLEPLGGMGKFVTKGQTVGILANSPWKHPGYYTNPDLVIVIADLCLKAGAGKVICFKPVPQGYWERGTLHTKYQSVISGFSYGTNRVELSIPGGVSLKKAEVFEELDAVDVFISVPVAKHHAGTIFSGNLKGMMGISASNTNRHMHSPDGEYTYEETEFLAQCIADLCLLRKPDLCIIDAIECGTENGPAGPGTTVKPGKIIAGKDPLAIDIYSSGLIGFDPDDILTFKRAYEHKLGESDLSKLIILELS